VISWKDVEWSFTLLPFAELAMLELNENTNTSIRVAYAQTEIRIRGPPLLHISR
jgi:hypothetical protein